MRAMNRRDYRVEQRQKRGRGGGGNERVRQAERERGGKEDREEIQEEVNEVCSKLYCASLINHRV